MKNKLLISVILILAFLIRVVNLENIPPNLHADEASFIINTASIIESGRDEDNRFLPIYLYSIKDFKPALYSYLQIPGFIILGISTFTSRIPAVIFGVISLLLIYLLVDEIFDDKKIALISLILLSISPWHIAISRATQEVIMAFTFCLWGFLLLFRIIKYFEENQKIPILKISLMTFANLLAMYSYHSYKIFIPAVFLTTLVYLYISSPRSSKNQIKISGLILASFLLPFIITFAGAMVRFSAIGLLSNDLPKAIIFEYTTLITGRAPIWFIRAFYNKPVFYFRTFLQNYFSHFTGSFLFLHGGKTARYLVPDQGWLHLIEIPLLATGLVVLIRKKKKKLAQIFLAAVLFASPIAASLTTEDIPSSDRPFQAVIFYTVITALGIRLILNITRKPIRTFLLSIVLIGYGWCFGYFFNQYYNLMPIYKQHHRSQDYQLLAKAIVDVQDDYDRVIVSNDLRELYIYLWFENQIELSALRKVPLERYEDQYQVGKYIFNRNQCDFSDAKKDDLLVGSSSCSVKSERELSRLKQTYFADGEEAHSLYVLN
ncbi:MAG: hypothetical protein XD98_0108 [Microgenomates bacterium 39_6]|nr:MAG: hypothetical protein XD98_0108 [Microgenomates bacterium 39_6]